jgi:hypothetical protein
MLWNNSGSDPSDRRLLHDAGFVNATASRDGESRRLPRRGPLPSHSPDPAFMPHSTPHILAASHPIRRMIGMARHSAAGLLLLVTIALPAAAQETGPPREWILTLHFDATKYFGDFTDNRFSSGGALSLRRYIMPLSPRWTLYGDLIIGAYDLQWWSTDLMLQWFDTTSAHVNDRNRCFIAPIEALVSFRTPIGPKGELFLGTGLEFAYYSPQNSLGGALNKPQEPYGKWTLAFPLRVDFDFLISDNLALNFHGNLHLTQTDFLDGLKFGNGPDAYLSVGIGVSYSFPPPDRDDDFDGLTNHRERSIYHTDPDNHDTDHDGLPDGEEIAHGSSPLADDTDGDGLTDGDEVHRFGTDPLNKDSDGDGLTDMEEVRLGTSPTRMDTDGDNLNDNVELAHGTDPLNRDTDGDGIPDGLETTSSPLLRDTDGDGLADADESRAQLRPYDEDFDGDGLFDAVELTIGTDPKKADTDNDGATDYVEHYCLMTDPRNPDSDGDGLEDGMDATPLDNTPLNPAKTVSWSFRDLFKRDESVDEASKSFLILLHVIRSAPKHLLYSIDIDVYGENVAQAKDRMARLEALLKTTTVMWDKPSLNVTLSLGGSASPDAMLKYVWRNNGR